MLNNIVFENITRSQKKILVVTKYWDTEKTQNILSQVEEKYPNIFFGLWENRIETIIEKSLPRNIVHFIGNIQSQKIAQIVKYCSVIHSLSSLKHAIKIENIWFPICAFIQINLDENKDIWISEDNLRYFLEACSKFKNLKIIWISGMWAWDISQQEKKEEFQKLISLRNTYLPDGLISAGTSRDYEIALEEWIDVVRVGQSAIIT
jgi:uncharacterized pyridoxal phosphate-containing UPF0001 family protein